MYYSQYKKTARETRAVRIENGIGLESRQETQRET